MSDGATLSAHVTRIRFLLGLSKTNFYFCYLHFADDKTEVKSRGVFTKSLTADLALAFKPANALLVRQTPVVDSSLVSQLTQHCFGKPYNLLLQESINGTANFLETSPSRTALNPFVQ